MITFQPPIGATLVQYYTGRSTGRSIATDSRSHWVQLWSTGYGLYAARFQSSWPTMYRTTLTSSFGWSFDAGSWIRYSCGLVLQCTTTYSQ